MKNYSDFFEEGIGPEDYQQKILNQMTERGANCCTSPEVIMGMLNALTCHNETIIELWGVIGKLLDRTCLRTETEAKLNEKIEHLKKVWATPGEKLKKEGPVETGPESNLI